MSNFKLKKDLTYRIERGQADTINNEIMTDELAVRFLKVRPERIELFLYWPENWEDLLQDKTPIDIVEEIKEERPNDEGLEDSAPVDKAALRKELKALKAPELRARYPQYKGTKAQIINKVILAL